MNDLGGGELIYHSQREMQFCVHSRLILKNAHISNRFHFTTHGPESPSVKTLSFTHILQMDFVKWPEERIIIAGSFTASTVSIRPTGSLHKVWVRIRALARGVSAIVRDTAEQ